MATAAKIFLSLGMSSAAKKFFLDASAASMAFFTSSAETPAFNKVPSNAINDDAKEDKGEPKIPSRKYWRCLLYGVHAA